jgi:hypothetical protein
MKGSRLKNSNNSMSLNNNSYNINSKSHGENPSQILSKSKSLISSQNNPITQNSQNFLTTSNPISQVKGGKIEEEYISNLQKQIYYLELEMKLMKDKEIETKNKVGGYEILFRDGVPLNEHFLALKTKYTNEKDAFEKHLQDLNSEILRISNENKSLQEELDYTNRNYFDIIEKTSQNKDFYTHKINELTEKFVNENNTKYSHEKDKDFLSKSIYKIHSENVHHSRTIEKNKLFKENQEEKNKTIKERNQNKFEEVDKLLIRSLLEQEAIEKKLSNDGKGKLIESENSLLITNINKLERELHMAKAKVSELENLQVLNRKYLLDEEMTKAIYEKEHSKLNDELDGLIKVNEESLRQKVKENEKNQSILIKNSISNNELKMSLILNKFKKEEAYARNLLEEKNGLLQKIVGLNEIVESQSVKENDIKRDIIEVTNHIHGLNLSIEENKLSLTALQQENELYFTNANKAETDIKILKKKIEEMQQKIELNTILKDIDVNELKVLSQNNAMVNSSINSLISKWDKVQSKLKEIEEKSSNNNNNNNSSINLG